MINHLKLFTVCWSAHHSALNTTFKCHNNTVITYSCLVYSNKLSFFVKISRQQYLRRSDPSCKREYDCDWKRNGFFHGRFNRLLIICNVRIIHTIVLNETDQRFAFLVAVCLYLLLTLMKKCKDTIGEYKEKVFFISRFRC